MSAFTTCTPAYVQVGDEILVSSGWCAVTMRDELPEGWRITFREHDGLGHLTPLRGSDTVLVRKAVTPEMDAERGPS